MTNLGTLAGDHSSIANSVNRYGQVVGVSSLLSTSHAFLWQNGTMTNLGTLSGATSSYAYSISDSGWVAAKKATWNPSRAAEWT
jgi:probable HAF family extracellular repeat protein